MKSQILYLFLPNSISQELFEIEGTVSKDLPPLRPINNCVFPEFLSPISAISFFEVFEFLRRITTTAKSNIKAVMIYIR